MILLSVSSPMPMANFAEASKFGFMVWKSRHGPQNISKIICEYLVNVMVTVKTKLLLIHHQGNMNADILVLKLNDHQWMCSFHFIVGQNTGPFKLKRQSFSEYIVLSSQRNTKSYFIWSKLTISHQEPPLVDTQKHTGFWLLGWEHTNTCTHACMHACITPRHLL